MGNMAYCRFSNTLQDLLDCNDHMEDGNLSDAENKARKQLIKLCSCIHSDYGDEEQQ